MRHPALFIFAIFYEKSLNRIVKYMISVSLNLRGIMEYTEEQQQFLDSLKHWFINDTDNKPVYVLTGRPGCGKSFITSKVQSYLDLEDDECCYAVFTGKAAVVLQSKGVDCQTIHHLIYRLVDDVGPSFEKRPHLDHDYKLIIIDEFSTVSQEMMDDLLSYGIPLLIVGDAEQLPPIGDQTDYLSYPDFQLTKVLRQKEGSFIIKLARGILLGKEPKPCHVKSIDEVIVKNFSDLTFEDLSSVDQVICGTNKRRHEINQLFRRSLGYVDRFPEVGEKIIITKNMWDTELNGIPIINGTLGYVRKVVERNSFLIIQFQPDYSEDTVVLKLDKRPFLGLEAKFEPGLATAEFGYAITVHKAQGSEFNSVLFIADPMPKRIYKRFLNTGVTRAKEKLIFVRC